MIYENIDVAKNMAGINEREWLNQGMIENELEICKWLMQRAVYDILLRPWFNMGCF